MPFSEIVNLLPSGDDLNYRTILVVANVTELATGKMLSGNSTVVCQRNQYELSFLDMTPDSYKPGLDLTGYVSDFIALCFCLP